MKTNIKRVAAALCSCTLLAAGLTACGSTEAESVMDPTVAVQVQNVRRGSIELQGTYVGSVSAAESVNVIPLVQGATVESVNVAVGSEVKQGQVLAKLDSTSADLTAKNAQAAYNSALAQAQGALGGQWKTNIYSAERGIDQLDDNIDNMNDQIDKLEDQKNQINNGYKNAKIAYETLNGANESYKKLKQTEVSVQVNEKNKQILGLPENSSGSTTLNIEQDYAKLEKLAALGEESGISEQQLTAVRAVMNYVNAQKAAGLEDAAIWASLTDDNVKTAKKGCEEAEAAVSNLESSIEQLETQRDSLKAQKETAEGTLDITQSETYNETVASLQAGLAQAQVGLDSAAYQQSLYTLTAPISGTVESVGLTKNGMASASSIAFTISNKNTMQVTFYVTEDVRDEFTAGQAVTVSRGSSTYSGTITEIGNAVDMQKGLFKVKATIYDMPDLASGVTASITTTCHSAKDVIVIPCDAVYYENGDAYVFVARDGTAVKTPVETGIYDDQNIAITSGLIEGQQVITTWSANLIDGCAITVPGQEEAEETADSAASAQG
ncbi:MAG: efflux RND transporter periplasmic adaptor subunit [Oscillospiraceae bacterium]|nr:efflux RND transporter periplasmic adaptor subunit [Oscillospiraceae bacterium]